MVVVALWTGIAVAQSLRQWKGKVVDEKGQAVAGATVHLLNTGIYTTADSAGNFSFAAPLSGTGELELSAAGFAKTIVAWNGGESKEFRLAGSSRQLDEVVVTADKKEESIQRLPVSVSSFGSRQVSDYRIWNIKDLTGIVPNLFASDPGDKRNVVSIRGITSSSYDPAVATYLDGVNQFSLDTYIGQLSDVERIEVLRGPQGTLYGRNAMGGVINVITRRPSGPARVYAEVSAGNYGLQRYSAGARVPLLKDRLYFSLAGNYEKQNGYYTNDYNGERYDRQQAVSGNYSLNYLPSQTWSVALNLKHQNNRNHGPFPLVMDKTEAFSNPYHLNQNATTLLVDNTLNASLTAKYSGASFQFSSQTAYQQNYRYYEDPIDADFSPIDGITIINNYGPDWNKVKVWTEELRFSSPAGDGRRLQWTGGAYFFLQQNPVKQATHFGEDAAMVGADNTNFSLLNSSTGKNRGLAFYGQLVYHFASRWELTGGLRYDAERRELSVLGEYLQDPDPQPQFVYQPDTTATVRFHAWSPRLNLAFHPNAVQTVYLSYSKGFRTGGLTPLSSDPSQPALYPYQPEYSHNWEAGWKWFPAARRWQLSTAVFYSIVKDVQVPTLVLPDAVTLIRNTGKLESKGLEAELQARPLHGLDISYSFGYTHARYDALKLSANGDEQDLGGKRQIFTPDISSMLAVQYRAPLLKNKKLSALIRGEWKYLGTQYFDLANTIEQSPYHLLNGRAGLEYRQIGLYGWVRNLSDNRYIGYAYDFGAVNLAPPRTWGLTLSVQL